MYSNWRIKISRKRYIFICHVEKHALPAVYANLNILIHGSKNPRKRTDIQLQHLVQSIKYFVKLLKRFNQKLWLIQANELS